LRERNGPAVRWSRVPSYKIIIENEEFTSSDDYECADDLAARKHAIGAVMAIASDQVAGGKAFFGAHVRIADGDDEMRFVVSAGASALKNGS
jgi:hypothetical protein